MPSWREQLYAYCQDDGLVEALCPPSRKADAWQPNQEDAALAWIVYTELRTRIATHALPLREGVESTALESLVDLFALARRHTVQHPQAQHAASLLVHCLNTHVRPLTAGWHPKAKSGALASLDQRFIFRRDLTRVQRTLRALASVFGQICADKDAADFLVPSPPQAAGPDTGRGHLEYGIVRRAGDKPVIDDMNKAERRILNLRRGSPSADADAPVNDAVGLAMSGGGIRSATFSLGIVQVLARLGILKDVDVLSTVSGGGYLGAFITSTMSGSEPEAGLGANDEPFAHGASVESKSIRYLRNHSKYLSEGGLGTVALMGFSAAYGIAMSTLLVAPALLLLAFLAVYVFGIAPTGPAGEWSAWSSGLWIGLGVVVVLLSVMRMPSSEVRTWIERLAISLLFCAIAVWSWQWVQALYALAAVHVVLVLVTVLLLPVALGATALWWGATTIPGRIAWSLLVAIGPLFFLSLWLIAVNAAIAMRDWNWIWSVTLVVGLLVYACFLVNINFASLHLYYRNRLARTYLRRVGAEEAVDPQALSSLNSSQKAPLHLINAAANLPGSKNPELRGRNTDFFTFAQHFCGGPSIGWWPTGQWEAKDGHLDLGTAMAISGAAAAPRMGTLTSAKYTTMLAMLNVRLGYWLRKPDSPGPKWLPPGATYFIRELLGWMHEGLAFVNLSDGGHIENLGIYELLRRRCRYIVAIDGEADPEHTFGGLLTALQMAKIDLGVEIDPDLSDLRDGIEHFKRAHFVMTRIDYGATENGERVLGLLLVIKLALTGNESEILMRYRRENPTFPHQSTAQQLFSESQFEAYRALGEHAAEAAFDSLLAGSPSPVNVSAWLRELEGRLLPSATSGTSSHQQQAS